MTEKAVTFFKYFPYSPVFRDWGFYVLSSGYSKVPAGHPYPPAQHPDHHNFNWNQGRVLSSFTFVYISRGQGIFDSESSGPKIIKEGSLFVAFPDIRHRYKPNQNTGWDEYWIEFSGDCAHRFIDKSPLTPSVPVLPIESISKIMNTFMEIADISQQEPYGFEYLLSELAFRLITQILVDRDLQADENKEKTDVIRKAKRTLIDNLSEPIDLQNLSAEFNMSYSLFRKTFKDFTGFSPHQYRLHFKMHRACQLLRSGNMQISHIAEQLGFSSIYYFSELFKKKNRCSPLGYRKNTAKVVGFNEHFKDQSNI